MIAIEDVEPHHASTEFDPYFEIRTTMKSFFSLLFRPRLIRHPDSFALTRAALWNSIANAIRLQQSQNRCVWLVAHFPDTFVDCQTMLEQALIPYRILQRPLDLSWFDEHRDDAVSEVQLILADLLNPMNIQEDVPCEFGHRLAIMVAERHPYGPRDLQLDAFASSLPFTAELGHFLSLQDTIVTRRIPPQAIEMLKTLGLQESDLISSSVIAKRLKKYIRKESAAQDVVQETDSAEQWYAIHDQSSESSK